MFQRTLFDFEDRIVDRRPSWLTDMYGEKKVFRTDAEAIVEDLNRFPSGKGLWIRCLEIDDNKHQRHSSKDYIARIWQQKGLPITKVVDHDGGVTDLLDPYPPSHYIVNGKRIRAPVDKKLERAWIDKDVLHLATEDSEHMAHIVPDSECHQYDIHGYDPSTNLEHFAIECYRHKIPKEMMKWRNHYVYGTPALKPFIRNVTEEDARKIDPMGQIPNGIVPNELFNCICDCADLIGLRLNLRQIVPDLENLAMYPIEHTCSSCLHRMSPNKMEDRCWEKHSEYMCFNYMWNRIKPANLKKVRHTSKTEDECDGYYC